MKGGLLIGTLLLLFIIAFLLGVATMSRQHDLKETTEQQSRAEQSDAQRTQGNPAESNKNSNDTSKDADQDAMLKANQEMARWSGLTVLLTIGLFSIAGIQAYYMLLKERAYLNFSEMRTIGFHAWEDPIFTLDVINSGNTPAFNVKATLCVKLSRPGLPALYPGPRPYPVIRTFETDILSAQGKMPIFQSWGAPLGRDKFDALDGWGGMKLRVLIEVEYDTRYLWRREQVHTCFEYVTWGGRPDAPKWRGCNPKDW